MNNFIEKPASKGSLAKRKLVYGVGINDASYIVTAKVDGKNKMCPYYHRWINMLERCYSGKYQARCPTYIGCSVCEEWLLFSNFKKYMTGLDWQGKELDKDILVQGNKIYSPDNCVFLTSAINRLLLDNKAARGKYPQGVTFNKMVGKFGTQCAVNGKPKNLGYFDNPDEASAAYKKFKYQLIAEVSATQPEPIRSALLAYKINF